MGRYPKASKALKNHRRWLECYGAEVIHPPKRNSKKPWSKRLRQWVASLRQIVETVYDKLFNAFGLWGERPHEIEGLRARLAAIPWLCTTFVSGSMSISVGLG